QLLGHRRHGRVVLGLRLELVRGLVEPRDAFRDVFTLRIVIEEAGFSGNQEECQADDQVQPEWRQVTRAPSVEEVARQASGLHQQITERAPQPRVGVRDAFEGLAEEVPQRVHVRFVPLSAGGTVFARQRGAAVHADERLRDGWLRRSDYRYRRGDQGSGHLAGSHEPVLGRGVGVLALRGHLVRLEVVDAQQLHDLAIVVAQARSLGLGDDAELARLGDLPGNVDRGDLAGLDTLDADALLDRLGGVARDTGLSQQPTRARRA